MSSIQIQWNCEIFGGLSEILYWTQPAYENNEVVEILRLTDYDLACLKASSIEYCIELYLQDIQNGNSHEEVVNALNKLTTYVLNYGLLLSINFYLKVHLFGQC